MAKIMFAQRARNQRSEIPIEVFDELERWVDHGIVPSNFIRTVLMNNLAYSATAASLVNLCMLGFIAKFVHFNVPHECRGTEERMKAWAGHQGLTGQPSIDRVDNTEDAPW